jgi:quercetin dioxygenase-like cupin family protein
MFMKAQPAAKYVIRRLIAAAAAATLLSSLSLLTAIASATPTIGISSVVLSKQTVNGKDYIVSDITIAPGGSTGWHTHQGEVFGIVKSGTLTRNVADCSIESVSNPGDPVTDPTGADHVHIGRNLGTAPVVLEVTYIDPAGAPTADSAPNPGCDFN